MFSTSPFSRLKALALGLALLPATAIAPMAQELQ